MGYKPEEVLGKSRHELPIWTPEEYERAEDTANQLIEKIGMDKPIEFETLLRTKDGRELNILMREAFLGEEVSKEIGFVTYLFDITELRKREAELQQTVSLCGKVVENVAQKGDLNARIDVSKLTGKHKIIGVDINLRRRQGIT